MENIDKVNNKMQLE